jgi:1,4-dihydroxy-2-naphthoate octaprenyltransferase
MAVGLDKTDEIRGLQLEGMAQVITNAEEKEKARELILGVTDAFAQQMDLPVACFVRVRPTLIKRVSLAGEPSFSFQEFPENTPPPLVFALGAALRKLKLTLRAVRVPFFTAALVPVALGAALAVWDGAPFDLTQLLWVALAACLAQAGANLANDYFDHRSRNDELNQSFTPLNGGSRVIQAGLWSPDKTLLASLLAWAGCAAVALFLLERIPTELVLTLGAAGFVLGFFYSGWPLRLAYIGLGDLAVAVGFGPLIVGGTYAALAGTWSWSAALAALPIAIAVALILFINSFQDRDADAAANKITSVVRLGSKQRAFHVYAGATAAVYISIVALVAAGPLPVWSLIALLTAPLALFAVRRGRDRTESIHELLPINAATIGMHLSMGLMLALGVVLAAVTGG